MIIFLILFIGISMVKVLISAQNAGKDLLNGYKAFYLAEAGIEAAKSQIVSNEAWVTDEPHAENDKKWLLCSAKGETSLFGEGGFKIVKERMKNLVYSVGYIGPDILKSRYYSFQKMEFELPFKQKKWEEL